MWILWVYLGVYLLAVWSMAARELDTGLWTYLIQTALVAVLYAHQGLVTHNLGIWISFLGLVSIRGLWIPWFIHKRLPPPMRLERDLAYRITPTFLVLFSLALGGLSFLLIASRIGPQGLPYGAALATLLTGLALMSLAHHAGKQMLGMLIAENGADLALATTLWRISVNADYSIFVEVALAVMLFVVLTLKLSQTNGVRLDHYHTLRG
ncbi:hypothetical protein D2Q93_13080 [Alicyclobacillaceae bacterium I2511]|nr:hypothetical protein D2Q93_13080 [Alicyclobacillaceae bacterium I2511]